MASNRLRSRAQMRRAKVEQDKAARKKSQGSIMGQPDREKEAGKKQREQHEKRSAQITKVVLSILFTWILGGTFLIATCVQLSQDRASVNTRWDTYLHSDQAVEQEANRIAAKEHATEVYCGTYLENLKELDVKSSSFRSVWLVWFKWQNDPTIDFSHNQFTFYNGTINDLDVLRNEVMPDGTHYQQFRVDVSISQAFHTPRFPLENHLLRIYIEPSYDIADVILRPSTDTDNLNANINVYSYEITRMASAMKYISYADNHDDPLIPDGSAQMVSEHMDEIEVNRVGWGLYVKCFIAIWGTTLWVLIMLFVATRHRVDVFGMIPGTLFGAVGNIMIGASLLPEALSLGLLEYGNIWGIFIVLAGTVTITILNRERNHWHNDTFADRYGIFMFITILALAIIGNLALPLASFQF